MGNQDGSSMKLRHWMNLVPPRRCTHSFHAHIIKEPPALSPWMMIAMIIHLFLFLVLFLNIASLTLVSVSDMLISGLSTVVRSVASLVGLFGKLWCVEMTGRRHTLHQQFMPDMDMTCLETSFSAGAFTWICGYHWYHCGTWWILWEHGNMRCHVLPSWSVEHCFDAVPGNACRSSSSTSLEIWCPVAMVHGVSWNIWRLQKLQVLSAQSFI